MADLLPPPPLDSTSLIALRGIGITKYFAKRSHRRSLIRWARQEYRVMANWKVVGDPILRSAPSQDDIASYLYFIFLRTPAVVDLVSEKHAEHGKSYTKGDAEENRRWCGLIARFLVEKYWYEIGETSDHHVHPLH